MNKNFIKNDEYVLKGHPDRITDGIAETIAMSIYNLDGSYGRSAVEAVYSGSNFVLGGEFRTSLSDKNFRKLVEWIVEKITSKQTKTKIKTTFVHSVQSKELQEDSDLVGWTDNCITYGYYNKETKSNHTPERKNLIRLARLITLLHPKELPDGKLISIDGKISISIEEGIEEEIFELLGISNPTIFRVSGSKADSGTVGRKLIAERHGNGIPHGGGAFSGKDFSKADKTLKLLADWRAEELGLGAETKLIQFSKSHHQTELCFYDVLNPEKVYDFVENELSEMEPLNPHYPISMYRPHNTLYDLYTKYAPVKPSMYLNETEIKELEKLLLKLSGKKKLEDNLW